MMSLGLKFIAERKFSSLFIDNQFVESHCQDSYDVYNPATGEVLLKVRNCDSHDVDRAVASSRKAFEGHWGTSTTGAQRAVFLEKLAKCINEDAEMLTELEALNNGKSWKEAAMDVADFATAFLYYAAEARELDKRQGEEIAQPDETLVMKVFHEPKGVCAGIIPWNYPLLMAAWKICPALAAGCTLVLKPSEITPLSIMRLAQLAVKAQLPPGVLNIVAGTGASCGTAVTAHAGIDKVAFTGSVPTGIKVMHTAADNLTDCTLELGGKSAAIILDDVNIDQAVDWVLCGIFWNSGQICSATSRLILQNKDIGAKFLDRLVTACKAIPCGSSLDNKETKGVMGPVVTKTFYEKILGFIERAKANQAEVLCGGGRPLQLATSSSSSSSSSSEKGYFIAPTILLLPHTDFEIWREEVFGPVLCVYIVPNFTDKGALSSSSSSSSCEKEEERCIYEANNTQFGLAASVFSSSEKRLDRVCRRLNAGIVWRNCSQPCPIQGPWGGNKKSGIGRECGRWGLSNYLAVKVQTAYVDKQPFRWFVQE